MVHNKVIPCTSLYVLSAPSVPLRFLRLLPLLKEGNGDGVGEITRKCIMYAPSLTTCVIGSVKWVQMSSQCVADVQSESCFLIATAEPCDCSRSPVHTQICIIHSLTQSAIFFFFFFWFQHQLLPSLWTFFCRKIIVFLYRCQKGNFSLFNSFMFYPDWGEVFFSELHRLEGGFTVTGGCVISQHVESWW